MLRKARERGLTPAYVRMDSWFFLTRLKGTGRQVQMTEELERRGWKSIIGG
jgi:hypothetical protein